MKRTAVVITGFGAFITTIAVSAELYSIEALLLKSSERMGSLSPWPIVGLTLLALGISMVVWQSSLRRRSTTCAVCASLFVVSLCSIFAVGLSGPLIFNWIADYLVILLPVIGLCALVVFAIAAWMSE